jgi:hypothetical protein
MHLTRFALPYSCCCGFSKNEKLLTDCIASFSMPGCYPYLLSTHVKEIAAFWYYSSHAWAMLVFSTGFEKLSWRYRNYISLDVLLGCLNRYMLAEGLGLSGIVAILFCGIVSAMFFALATMGSTRVIFFQQFLNTWNYFSLNMFSFLQPIHFCCSACHLLLSPPAAIVYLQKKFRHDFTVTTLLAIQGSQTDKVLYHLSFCSLFFHLQLMKHYTFPNLSDSAQVFTAGFFQLISSVAETFVYVFTSCLVQLPHVL